MNMGRELVWGYFKTSLTQTSFFGVSFELDKHLSIFQARSNGPALLRSANQNLTISASYGAPPLPENSDQLLCQQDQSFSEFWGRGGWGVRGFSASTESVFANTSSNADSTREQVTGNTRIPSYPRFRCNDPRLDRDEDGVNACLFGADQSARTS